MGGITLTLIECIAAPIQIVDLALTALSILMSSLLLGYAYLPFSFLVRVLGEAICNILRASFNIIEIGLSTALQVVLPCIAHSILSISNLKRCDNR